MAFTLANVDGRAALVQEGSYFDLGTISDGAFGSDPMAALGRTVELSALADSLGERQPTGALADAQLGAPVPRPRNCFAIGLNYQSHAAESGMEVPAVPLTFTKFPSCIVGPTATVELRSDAVDYEGELVVVIGAAGRDIAVADAWGHVAGLTIGQDISDRPAQFAASPPHFDLGKSFDTFGPMGPVLVSVDSLQRPEDLHITTLINGEVRQDASTSMMIFDVPTLVSYLSRFTTLQPGDVIFTGTPDGIGMATGRFLADGDVITTTIEGIGTMTNRCVRVSDYVKEAN
ncbi:MAG: FAA hydrolase family protein [Actinobacteria bacterium]|nr:FAA hydrolase family protein [Actinomycetota bacterium]